jgi:prepilin-type N-terminal cleavage/methylation domain-containing protein
MEGFTLIEIIVTITLVAVLAALFVQHMGTAFMRSGEPINLLNQTYEVNQVVEKLTADYRDKVKEAKSRALDLVSFKGGLSSFDENGVACSGLFLEYRDGLNLIDIAPTDQIYEAQKSSGEGATPTKFLLVTVDKNNKSTRVLFTTFTE